MSDVAAPAPASTTSTPSTPASTPSGSGGSSTPTSPTSSSGTATRSAGQQKGTLPPPNHPDAEKPAGTTQTPAEKVEAARRKYQLKVDGKIQEMELGDDEVAVRLQKSMGAEKRMQEAAQLRKQQQEWIEALKADPFSALKDPAFGVDLEKLAEDRLIQKYRESQMPEHERRLLEKEREISQYKQREAQVKAQQEAKVRGEMEQRVFQEMERDFAEALAGEELPKNRQTMVLMAEVARANLEHGIELTPKQMASEVNARMRDMNSHVIRQLKGEQLAKYLGDDVVKEILRHSISRVKPAQPPAFERPAAPANLDLDEVKPARRMNDLRSFREFMKK